METRDPEPGQQHLDSQDAVGASMETDETAPPEPALISRYHSVMDDDGLDDVFLPPPPPSCMAPLLPAEGSTEAIGANNPSVTLINVAADAIEAKANPSGLDWHHGEKQDMAGHEAKAITPEESTDSESTLSYNQDQTSMEDVGTLLETCADRSEAQDTTGDEVSNADSEESVTLGGRLEDWRENEAETDDNSEQLPENSGYGTDSEGDVCGDNDRDFESWEPSELVKFNQCWTEGATNQPEVSTEMSGYDVDTRSFDYNNTKCDWVRRESAASETRECRLSVSEGSEESVSKRKHGDGSRQIATDIHQGEQLLQRLQQVKLRQDVCGPESRRNVQQTAQDMTEENDGGHETAGEKNATATIEGEERISPTDDDNGEFVNQMERQAIETNEDEDAKGRMSTPVEPEHQIAARIEAGDSEEEEKDGPVSSDLSPISIIKGTTSSHIPFPSTHHRFSAAETPIERQMQDEFQEKQNLQRAGGLFNLADNPDVLEIPFKTRVSLGPLTVIDPQSCQGDYSPFSEQKMHKEISQEIQRELVLENLGKIPGENSRGEVRQLKDMKLLFEAFQQDKTEGPTRHRRSPTLLMKGPVYPSVLERTHSLEIVSLQGCPIPRAHSLRLPKSTSETRKSLESLRAKKGPTASSPGKTLLLPDPKPGVIPCLNRSMDSIHKKKSDMETVRKTEIKKTIQGSPIIKQNPFCKLRPALALQPEVEKDIREAKEREEELRRQRSTLYGENRSKSEDGEKFPPHDPDVRQQSTGKLERVWPPPSKKDQKPPETTQQEPKVHRAGGQKAPLWQRWESGQINGPTPKNK